MQQTKLFSLGAAAIQAKPAAPANPFMQGRQRSLTMSGAIELGTPVGATTEANPVVDKPRNPFAPAKDRRAVTSSSSDVAMGTLGKTNPVARSEASNKTESGVLSILKRALRR